MHEFRMKNALGLGKNILFADILVDIPMSYQQRARATLRMTEVRIKPVVSHW